MRLFKHRSPDPARCINRICDIVLIVSCNVYARFSTRVVNIWTLCNRSISSLVFKLLYLSLISWSFNWLTAFSRLRLPAVNASKIFMLLAHNHLEISLHSFKVVLNPFHDFVVVAKEEVPDAPEDSAAALLPRFQAPQKPHACLQLVAPQSDVLCS